MTDKCWINLNCPFLLLKMLAFSGEFVNPDGLSGQVNPASSNKDPQSISKPIALPFSNIPPPLACKFIQKSSFQQSWWWLWSSTYDAVLMMTIMIICVHEKIPFTPNVFTFKVALFARLSLMSRHLCPFMQQLQGFHKMQKSKTHFHSAKLQYCSKFLTRKRIITLKRPFETLCLSETNKSRTFLVREKEKLL